MVLGVLAERTAHVLLAEDDHAIRRSASIGLTNCYAYAFRSGLRGCSLTGVVRQAQNSPGEQRVPVDQVGVALWETVESIDEAPDGTGQACWSLASTPGLMAASGCHD